jgi:hypothetical protein
MKKVNTGAATQSRNFSEQKLTIGLDLGDRSSWYGVLNEAGSIVLEQNLGTTPKAMREGFGGMPRSRIALETGMHLPWVSRALSELGHEVIVAHARNVRLIGESRKKDDRLDAQTLARLARIDPQWLSPVKHRGAKAQADLTVIRARAGLVRARTALVNTARGLAKSYGEHPSCWSALSEEQRPFLRADSITGISALREASMTKKTNPGAEGAHRVRRQNAVASQSQPFSNYWVCSVHEPGVLCEAFVPVVVDVEGLLFCLSCRLIYTHPPVPGGCRCSSRRGNRCGSCDGV